MTPDNPAHAAVRHVLERARAHIEGGRPWTPAATSLAANARPADARNLPHHVSTADLVRNLAASAPLDPEGELDAAALEALVYQAFTHAMALPTPAEGQRVLTAAPDRLAAATALRITLENEDAWALDPEAALDAAAAP